MCFCSCWFHFSPFPPLLFSSSVTFPFRFSFRSCYYILVFLPLRVPAVFAHPIPPLCHLSVRIAASSFTVFSLRRPQEEPGAAPCVPSVSPGLGTMFHRWCLAQCPQCPLCSCPAVTGGGFVFWCLRNCSCKSLPGTSFYHPGGEVAPVGTELSQEHRDHPRVSQEGEMLLQPRWFCRINEALAHGADVRVTFLGDLAAAQRIKSFVIRLERLE